MTKKLLILVILMLVTIPAFAQHVDTAWVRRYNGPGNDRDEAYAIAVDTSGNVYVTGKSIGSGTSEDYATIKYDSSGNQRWLKRYNGPGNGWDRATAIAVGDSGYVYVTGRSTGAMGDEDYATIKYYPCADTACTAWVRRYDGAMGNLGDAASDIAVDGSGNVYVTGLSVGSGSGQDYITLKYTRDGDTAWVERYDEVGYDDNARAIAVDTSGNVYVTGEVTATGTSYDFGTIKYYPNGDTAWVRRYNGPGNYWDKAYAMAIDRSGNVYVTGFSYGSVMSADYALIKYDSSGNVRWVRRYDGTAGGDDRATAVTVDDSNNVYLTGASSSVVHGFDYVTVKYDSAGNWLWVATYDGPAHYHDEATAIVLDDSGNVYVTGSSYGTISWYPDYATVKYDPAGNELWVARYNGPGNETDGTYAIAVDDSHNVYVTGYSAGSGTSSDYATIKYVQFLCGDVNNDGVVDVADVMYLINYLFISGSAPDPLQAGDVNRDGAVDIADVMYLINYLFIGGSPPCEP